MSNVKPYTCVDCGLVGEQSRLGPNRLRCEPCGEAWRVEWMRKHRASTPKPATRSCLTCGGSFPWAHTPYCSKTCRSPRKCRGCGKEFNRKNFTYCSDACRPSSEVNRKRVERRMAPLPDRTCGACGTAFTPRRRDQRWCSRKCKDGHYGALLRAGEGQRGGLSSEARERQRLYWQAKNRRRRAAKRGGASEPYTLAEIAERDGFRCQLCGGLVPMDVKVPEALAPTVDHVVAVVRGGDDTKANVQLAHFRCNSAKGPREAPRLALVVQEVSHGAC